MKLKNAKYMGIKTYWYDFEVSDTNAFAGFLRGNNVDL
jgi:hypothetical protein